ncbi:hypothetical protein [Microbacterium allomyrinae]|uniref:Uncharacterized protein n=1 Tax=Microbacterium allomyrinae TaxID=2830666 RepID=A0A9X1S0M6_9MICO|nr:hypothetical protein [Microbacterium allomyrinae]MCC2030746.1 hypothetical protein [Microbacterium allomyrinae]
MNDRDPESSAIPNSELTRRDETLWKAEVSRRGTLTAAAWAVPVIAMAAATPAAVASGPFDPTSDLQVAALGGAEGRYTTGSNFTNGVVSPNTDFRRAFSVTNVGEGTFSGTLRIDFTFPRMWNQGTGSNTDAFQNYSTVDLGGSNGGSIGGKSSWTVTTAAAYTQNTGTNAWTAVWLRMDPAYFTLTNVVLPPGGTVRFALNAAIPFSWIGSAGPPPVYFPNSWRIYWRSPVSITATTSSNVNLGTYVTPVGGWTDGIWYFNGGGPFAYDGGGGIYPAYGTA